MNTFVQGTLSILFALVVVIVLIAGVVVALRAIRGDRRPPLTEDDPVPSKRFAPSGLIPTPAERELQRQWQSALAGGPPEK